MGGGKFSNDTYQSSKSSRASMGFDDFEHSKQSDVVHENLDCKRIHNKPFGKLESRDSIEHLNSTAVIVGLDVTGSNIQRAREAQRKLPKLMDRLVKYLPDPQVAIAANDDYHSVGEKAIQFADFESDNRVDEHLRNVLLTSQGGGNHGESYDLMMWIAANRTIIDCYEKRGKKGYFFMYADEPIFSTTSGQQLNKVLGVNEFSNSFSVPIKQTIAKLKETYDAYVIWPQGGFTEAHEQFVELFGQDHVVTLQHPNLIVEAICAVVAMKEGQNQTTVVEDLTGDDLNAAQAAALANSLFNNRPINIGA
jgi:hypothetical protein